MKKWMNTLFLGSSFIAAILIEAYSISILGNLLIAAGLGVIVLITGYLLMDSIRNQIQQGSEAAKFYIDRIMGEESDKWNERYSELLNLQKANYTATKKNSAILEKKFEEVLLKIETLEDINVKAQQKILDLQGKALEGQKNALNYEINYNRESAKQIIEALHEEAKNNDVQDQLDGIIALLDIQSQLIKESNNRTDTTIHNATRPQPKLVNKYIEDDFEYNNIANNDPDISVDSEYANLTDMENASESDWSFPEESDSEALNSTGAMNEEEKPTIIPLYDDPNKALTTDEIASLFASFGQ
ncbi:MAG TPA: hypothetical protein VN258_00315 [Mobilitalea sp.]|nr:hypothetical protein [Mobilitalea sp.]